MGRLSDELKTRQQQNAHCKTGDGQSHFYYKGSQTFDASSQLNTRPRHELEPWLITAPLRFAESNARCVLRVCVPYARLDRLSRLRNAEIGAGADSGRPAARYRLQTSVEANTLGTVHMMVAEK